MEVDLRHNTGAIALAVRKAPEKATNVIHKSLEASAIYAQSCFRRNINVGVSGALRRSVTYSWLNKVRVRVEPTLPYADYLEYGTRPHYPPLRAITPWARLRGINPYVLQRHIGRHGTKAHPFLNKTLIETENFAVNNLDKALDDFIKETL